MEAVAPTQQEVAMTTDRIKLSVTSSVVSGLTLYLSA